MRIWLAAVTTAFWGGVGWAAVVDHTPFDQLLRDHVENGQVDYKALALELGQLDAYIETLSAADLAPASRADSLAFYINAYNACTIRLILRHHGQIQSIRDIPKPWKTREWRIAGEILSLDEIEHQKLRAQLHEPRIHFAIVCASIGCPDLANQAYTAAGLEAQLDEATRRFLRSPKHLRKGMKKGWLGTKPVLELSRIFKWFGEDFKRAGEVSLVDFVSGYADPETRQFIRDHQEKLKIEHLSYDWKLNEKPAAR